MSCNGCFEVKYNICDYCISCTHEREYKCDCECECPENIQEYTSGKCYVCTVIDCPNIRICGIRLPRMIMNCYRGRCFNCDITWGRDFIFSLETEDCPICGESNLWCVKQPFCNHKICVDCFKNMGNHEVSHPNLCPLCRSGTDCPQWKNTDDFDRMDDDTKQKNILGQ